MAAALRPLRLPGLPEPRPRLLRQRARQLARRDRPRGPRLRRDRQPAGDRGAVLRHALRARAARPAARRPARGAARRGVTLPALYAAEAVAFARAGPARRRVRARRGPRPRDLRRLDRLGGARPDPRVGGRRAGAGRAAARGQRAAQHRLHRRRGRRAGAGRRSWSPAPGVETALLADAVSFLAVAVLLALARRLPTPRPTSRGRLGSACASASPTSRDARRCAACSAPRRRRSSSSPS